MYMTLGKGVCAGPMLMISQTGGVYMYLSYVNDMTNLRWISVSNDKGGSSAGRAPPCLKFFKGLFLKILTA